MSNMHGNVALARQLVDHPAFHITNPNNCYSLFLGFARSPVNFHALDGSGYEFLADAVLKVRGAARAVPAHPSPARPPACLALPGAPAPERLSPELGQGAGGRGQAAGSCRGLPLRALLQRFPGRAGAQQRACPCRRTSSPRCGPTAAAAATTAGSCCCCWPQCPPPPPSTQVDKLNNQVAARLVGAFTTYRQYDEQRQALMRAALERISKADKLSENVFEIVSKSLQ
jgi:hypothetical protein